MKNNRHTLQNRFRSLPKRNSGYILVLTIVLLAALLVMSLSFFKRTADSLQVSGYNRYAAESLVVAESAMNMLYGRYVYNADLDGDGVKDIEERIDLKSLTDLPLPYMYFVSTDTEIDQKLPSILQRIANGEARGEGHTLSNHQVSSDAHRLLISNLTTSKAKPVIFQFNDSHQLVKTSRSWTDLASSSEKGAAVWLELVKNEDMEGTVQVYVQAVGKAGSSKSYLQRYIGNFKTTLGVELGGLNESSL